MSSPFLSFIITSAGKGLRFGKSMEPKQYHLINGIPIFIYSLISISKLRNKKEIFLTINKSQKPDLIKKILKKYKLDEVKVILGGKTRAESVLNAFHEIKSNNGLIIIHDSVRPNFNFLNMKKIIKNLNQYSGTVVASKIYNTVKSVKNNSILKTLDRSELWVSETPQIFKYKALASCYKKDGGKFKYTDEAELLEKNRFKIKIYDNKEFNMKITTKEDLKIYKQLLRNV